MALATKLMTRGVLLGALLGGAACDDSGSSAPPADLSVAAAPDQARPASPDSDGGLPATCATPSGADACDPATQYCTQCLCGAPVHPGAPWPNGASGCVALPAACATTPTCACVLANSAQSGCTCTMVGTQVVVTCVGP